MDKVPVAADGTTDPEDLEAWLDAAEAEAEAAVGARVQDITRERAERYVETGDVSVWDGSGVEIRDVYTALAESVVGGAWLAGAALAFDGSPLGVAINEAADPGEVLSDLSAVWVERVNDDATEAIRTATNRLVGISDEVWVDVRAKLTEAVDTGVDIQRLSREVAEIADVSRRRAETIARTEVLDAFSAGEMAGATALGPLGPVEKVWWATRDSRTRDTHRRAHGQYVPFDDRFEIGRSQMSRPHDRSAPPEETVACRCTMLMLYPGDTRPDGSVVPGEVELPDREVTIRA